MNRNVSEGGAVLPLVGLSMVMLMGFAALAVDVGVGYSEVRTSQNSADASVMAAAVEVKLGSVDVQAMVTNAVVYASNNLPGSISAADWLAACPDSVNPGDQLSFTAAELGLAPATDCISFSYGFDTIRVSLPERPIVTRFAGAIGFDSFDVSAFAHATVRYEGDVTTPPFVVTDGTEAGDERCLRAGGAVSVVMVPKWQGNGPGNAATLGPEGDPAFADPCDDSVFDREFQFFGSLKAWSYEHCNQPSGNDAIALVIANGIDHRLGSYEPDYTSGDPELVDGDGCKLNPPIPQPYPNTIELQTGYTAQLLMLGLLDIDPDLTTPRLKRSDHVQSDNRFAAHDMDNTPLWEYLRSDIADVNAPASCVTVYQHKGDMTYDHFDLKELMVDCLDKWKNNPSDDIIFADTDDVGSPSITTSGRFAWIPILAEDSLNGLVGKNVHMDAFVPVFINTLYQISKEGWQTTDCWSQHSTQIGPKGWSRHQAGQQFDCANGGNNAQITALTAIVLPCGALPDTICMHDSVSGGPGGDPVEIVELSR